MGSSRPLAAFPARHTFFHERPGALEGVATREHRLDRRVLPFHCRRQRALLQAVAGDLLGRLQREGRAPQNLRNSALNGRIEFLGWNDFVDQAELQRPPGVNLAAGQQQAHGLPVGACRTRRWMPPLSAANPTRGSGKPNSASSTVTARSQASTISRPPPSAWPLTAAISGLSRSKRCVRPAKPEAGKSSADPVALALRSDPEQNAPSPAPRMTASRRSASEPKASKRRPSS